MKREKKGHSGADLTADAMSSRKYTALDFLRIPFAACPWQTALTLTNKLIKALVPSLQAAATAAFVDTALSIFQGVSPGGAIAWPLLSLILLVAFGYLSWYADSYASAKLEMKLTLTYRPAMVEKRARLRYEHIENSESWELISRTCREPVERILQGFTSIVDGASLLITVASLLCVLMAQVWWAGLLILLVSIPLFWLSLRAGQKGYEEDKKAKVYNRRADYFQEVLLGRKSAEERGLFGYESYGEKRWGEAFEKARKINLRVTMKYFIRIKSSSLLTVVVSALISVVLLYSLSQGEISTGMFIGLVSAALNLVQTMSWQLGDVMESLAKNREYMKDLTAFFALSETQDPLTVPAPMDSISFESIECRNVSFRYPGTETYILKDFNLMLKKGVHYAFVGINGAGKTTLTKLLTGLYDTFEGEILLNGRDIRSYTQAELKSLFAVVYQDFARYEVTLRENIALGDTRKEREEDIRSAAEQMELSPVIDSLPKGMDTPLGKIKEGGAELSGGEWQRVAIARALYSPAQIQILDEPTAALDPTAESHLYELFGRVSAGKSTIFITHRLGAAKLADEIVVINNGKVWEKGTHEELIKAGGIYAEMFQAQRSWYE